ncbi:sialate O-acetylesterase [Sphingobacterium arenae]|uniref:Sialate O-acetylesterase n=1 Tax=Sphingobacterium arenae TaxID=1280598 RepID=A0ABR7XYR6_9SPHI|nr:sialate O-acetylesterase [Sphingobacterium arenae]MBD1424189.1 sialate O-acetylesterase [Sphingobacterium arenae]
MKSPKSILLFLLVLSLNGFQNLRAQTKLNSLFGDHMVLQQHADVAIWGTDKPHTAIKIEASWGEQASVTTNADGTWKTTIKTIAGGGPYTLQVQGSRSISLKDVLLGEVWLCSGQSNMEMPLAGFAGQPVIGANELILNSENENLRLFHVKRNSSAIPLDTCTGIWKNADPGNVAKFSAVAYMYGKILQEKLKIPVGIICSSVGGTRVEAWTNKETLTSNGFDYASIKEPANITVNSPSALFNAMIHPLIPYGIKGAIWYQGESNRNKAELYQTYFQAMISSWRKEWRQGDFPFYFVQIAPFNYGNGVNAAFLREAQLKTWQNTPNTGMAVTMDIGEENCIHPAHKQEVSQRLAYWALADTYGYKGIQYSGPIYKSMDVVGNKAKIHFDYAPGGVCSFNKELKHFEIAGEDQVFHPAVANIQKGSLTVYSEVVSKPVAVRYAWKSYADGSLFNVFGLPASSFRTDNWN